jgi:hypothetical protein
MKLKRSKDGWALPLFCWPRYFRCVLNGFCDMPNVQSDEGRGDVPHKHGCGMWSVGLWGSYCEIAGGKEETYHAPWIRWIPDREHSIQRVSNVCLTLIFAVERKRILKPTEESNTQPVNSLSV